MKIRRINKFLAKMLVVCMSVSTVLGDVSMISAAEQVTVSEDAAKAQTEEVKADIIDVESVSAEELDTSDSAKIISGDEIKQEEDKTTEAEKSDSPALILSSDQIKPEVEESENVGADATAENINDFNWSGDDHTIITGFSEEFKSNHSTSDTFSIVIPERTTGIVSKAFSTEEDLNSDNYIYNKNIVKVDFSRAVNLEVIMSNAFYEVKILKEIDLSSCVKLTKIRESAFMKCSALERVRFNDTLQYIEKSAFEGCLSISEIVITPEVLSIGERAFYECTALTSVTVNTARLTDTAVGEKIFYKCAISDIRFDNPEMTTIPANLFNYAGFVSGTVVTIPEQITDIGAAAFEAEKGIISVNVKSRTLKSIRAKAFSGSDLTQITFADGKPESIGESAFSGCGLLSSFDFNGVKYIDGSAFEGCLLLSEIALPDTVEKIGAKAFKKCLVAKVTRIPHNTKLTAISKECFHGCGQFKAEMWDTINTLDDYALAGIAAFTKVVNNAEAEDGTIDLKYITELKNGVFVLSGLKKIFIPVSLRKMGTGVFKAATKLKQVEFENNTSGFGNTMPKECFGGCESLEAIQIPNEIEVIDEYAFGPVNVTNEVTGKTESHECERLENVRFSQRLKKINKFAFSECKRLSNLELPETLTDIGEQAFSICESLISVTIPQSVITMGEKAFCDDAKIKKLEIKAADLTKTGKYIFQNCNIDTVILPSNMKLIPDYMLFMAGYSTEGVTIQIPDTVTSIGKYAFAGESTQAKGIVNITGVNFSERSMLKTIDDGAFAYCSKLTSLALPKTVETIGKEVFLNDVFATMIIPEKVTNIGDRAFKNCQSMRTIRFEGTILTTMGESSFENCTSLTTVDLPAGLGSMGKNAFKDCSNLVHIYVPSSVVTVGEEVFRDCNKVSVAALGGSVIANKCLSENVAVDSRNIAKVTYILGDETVNNDAANTESFEKASVGHDVVVFKEASYAGFRFDGWYRDSAYTERIESTAGLNDNITVYAKFSPLQADESIFVWDETHKVIKGLTEEGLEQNWVIIPKCAESIAAGAFKGNKKINAIDFERDGELKYIRDEAFMGCVALRRLNLNACNSLETIGKNAFSGCLTLGKVVFNEDLVAIGENAFENCKILKEIEFKSGLKTLSYRSFRGCEMLSKIIINSTDLTMASTTVQNATEVQYDGDAFDGCAITDIVFGQNRFGNPVDKIPPAIFANATFAITELVIPAQIKTVGLYAFAYGGKENKLEKVDFSAMNTANFSEKIFEGNGTIKEVILPAVLETLPEKSFYNASKIDNVVVPSGVTVIGKKCFSGAINLKHIELPQGLKIIDDSAFANDSELELTSLPSTVEKIGNYAFSKDSDSKVKIRNPLLKISIDRLPANLKHIGQNAFSGSSIKTIDIPAGVVHIGKEAFRDCASANSINIAASNISTISANVFDGCVNASGEIQIPETVKKIDANAFNNCKKITKVRLSAGLTDIGSSAFAACPITELSVSASLSLNKIGQRAFYGNRLGRIEIPKNVTVIGDEAFATDDIDNAGVTSIIFNAEKVSSYGNTKGVFNGRELQGELLIAEGVALIPNGFLRGMNSKVDSVTIPATVEKIGDNAFSGTGTGVGIRNIKAFEFADGSVLKDIGVSAFQYTEISEIKLPDAVENVGKLAFSGCSELRRAILSKGLKQIPAQCFYLSSNLQEVVFRQSPTTMVNSQAFGECTAVRSILLPGTVKQIGPKAFDRMTSLETLFIPASVEKIESDILNGCDKTKVTIYTTLNSKAYNFAIENGYNVSVESVYSINYTLGSYMKNSGMNPTCYFTGADPVVFEPAVPSRSGYVFDGWFLDEARTNRIESTAGLTGDLTLYVGFHTDNNAGNQGSGSSSGRRTSSSARNSSSAVKGSSTYTGRPDDEMTPPESLHGSSDTKSSSSSSIRYGSWDIRTLSINKVIEVTANISTRPKIFVMAGDTVSINVLGMIDYDTVTIKTKSGAVYDRETHHVKLGSGKDSVKVMRMVNGKPKAFLIIKAEVPQPKMLKLKMGKSKKIKLNKSKAKIDGYTIEDDTIVKIDSSGYAIPVKSGSTQISAWINGHEFVIPVTVK